MDNLHRYHKTIATIIVVALIALVIYLVVPFFNAFFFAFILFVVFRPLYLWFVKKRLSRGLSATIILIIVGLVVIIPLAIGINLLVKEISSLAANQGVIMEKFHAFDSRYPSIDMAGILNEQIGKGQQYIKNAALAVLQNTSKVIISLVITFFSLYFLLINSESLAKSVKKYSPFSRKNTEKIYYELKNITDSTIITTGLISLLQGFLLGLVLFIFGVKGAVFWGFIGFILAFLPFVGVSLVWIPAGLIQIVFEQDYFAGIGIMICGLILSNTDNMLRPFLQQKIGKIHPFITLAGVFIGVPVFGILGFFIGPIVLSFTMLVTDIYFEEYVTPK